MSFLLLFLLLASSVFATDTVNPGDCNYPHLRVPTLDLPAFLDALYEKNPLKKDGSERQKLEDPAYRQNFYTGIAHAVRLDLSSRLEFLEWASLHEPDSFALHDLTWRIALSQERVGSERVIAWARRLSDDPLPERIANGLEVLARSKDPLLKEKCESLLQNSTEPLVIASALRFMPQPEIARLETFFEHPSLEVKSAAIAKQFRAGGAMSFKENAITKHAMKSVAEYGLKSSAEEGTISQIRWDERDLIRRLYLLRFPDLRFHPLYSKMPETFFNPFIQSSPIPYPKDGSELYLLGGPLAGRVVAHILSKRAAAAWRKAFAADWKSAGFDYNPVEPILTEAEISAEYGRGSLSEAGLRELKQRAKKKSLVFSRVILGPAHNYENYELHPTEGQKNTIISTLKNRFKISHGHPHGGNFVLLSDKGQIREILIDWDQAKSIVSEEAP